MDRIETVAGRTKPDRMEVIGTVVLGRSSDTDLRVFDDMVSRRHCQIVEKDGVVWLEDLGSANGTHLNGERIEKPARLFDGDVVRLGDVELRFLAGDSDARETVVPDRQDEVEAAVDPEHADPTAELDDAAGARRLRLVCDTALTSADAQDPDGLVKAVLELIVDAFGPDRSTISLGTQEAMRIAAAEPADATPPRSRTLTERVLGRGEAVLIRDALDEALKVSESIVASRYRSTMAAPLKLGDAVGGYITVEALAPGRYQESDLRALAAVARQAALALRTLRTLSGARAEIRRLQVTRQEGAPEIIGASGAMLAVRERIAKAAPADSPVLVVGETGTGKELVARRLHAESPRSHHPFVALNCAALVEGLLESEFFGHERGAFTDAKERRDGRITEAGEGTLFLDEVGDLPASLQAKLLRVLSERTFTRVGGRDRLPMQCRIVAATNRDLMAMVKDKRFREDLYYRLAVLLVDLPPLRERNQDILILAESGLERIAGRLGRRPPELAIDAREALLAYHWPGNVRELFNVLERAVVLLDGEVLRAQDLPVEIRSPGAVAQADVPAPEVLDLKELERRAVIAALKRTGGKKGQAAALLGVSWPTLNRKIRQYGITVEKA